jgi:hypothetical protein
MQERVEAAMCGCAKGGCEFPELAANFRSFFSQKGSWSEDHEKEISNGLCVVATASLFSAWLFLSLVSRVMTRREKKMARGLVPRDWSLLVPLPDSPLSCSASLSDSSARQAVAAYLHACTCTVAVTAPLIRSYWSITSTLPLPTLPLPGPVRNVLWYELK